MTLNLKVFKKSEKLLIQTMGQEDYDKFVENGKIEVVHDGVVYELDHDARVYNRTTCQSYCIEPISDNLPILDQIAIKYSYLKNDIERIEKVAHKRNINITIPSPDGIQVNDDAQRELGNSRDNSRRRGYYESYVGYLENRGWSRKHIDINENMPIVALNSVSRNTTDYVIDITCPAGQKITISGTYQTRGTNAHSLKLRLAGIDDNAEPQCPIRIIKENPTGAVVQLARIHYRDISMEYEGRIKRYEEFFRFKDGIELDGNQHLRIYTINPDIDISRTNTRLSIEADLWNHDGN